MSRVRVLCSGPQVLAGDGGAAVGEEPSACSLMEPKATLISAMRYMLMTNSEFLCLTHRRG